MPAVKSNRSKKKLKNRAKVKKVHYRTGQAYAQQGRVVVQGHHNIHNRAR